MSIHVRETGKGRRYDVKLRDREEGHAHQDLPHQAGPTAAQRRAHAKIAKALGGVGLCLPGSVATRSYRCGKPNCACHANPPHLHGPYIQWTRHIDGKTVHTNLIEQQLTDYQQLCDNARRLRELLEQLEALTLQAIHPDSHSKR